MKLRILDSSLRFRLTRKEVQKLQQTGEVESRVRFAPDRELRYCVTSTVAPDTIQADYSDHCIRVQLPKSTVLEWCKSDQVSIQAAGQVEVLIEKDFQCLHGPDRSEPDAFPNPLADQMHVD